MKMVEFNSALINAGINNVPAKSSRIIAEFNGEGYIDTIYFNTLKYASTVFITIDDITYSIQNSQNNSTAHHILYSSKGIVTTTGLASSYESYATVIQTKIPTGLSGRAYGINLVSHNSASSDKTRFISLSDESNYLNKIPNQIIVNDSNSTDYSFAHPLKFKKNFKFMFYNNYSSATTISFRLSAILED